MIRRPPRSTLSSSSAASDVYKRQTAGLPRPNTPIRVQAHWASSRARFEYMRWASTDGYFLETCKYSAVAAVLTSTGRGAASDAPSAYQCRLPCVRTCLLYTSPSPRDS
eukprot:TRINITY_DN35351_c0_g1_i1.p1 TRINITY_DN35351_c0_g1~~TRINITY_DN35351_c0_g1_i1.p1  ORF type:complete len:109 (+),score=10.09 TRINITY_DN35351_c0_g1_i1:88-414(+)